MKYQTEKKLLDKSIFYFSSFKKNDCLLFHIFALIFTSLIHLIILIYGLDKEIKYLSLSATINIEQF